MENLIELKDINLQAKDKKILKNISFSVAKNDFITIVGPNGAGKTSLLSIILKINKASSGKVFRNNNLKIGYIPQKIQIDDNMPIKVRDFLALCEDFSDDFFYEIIEKTKISDLLDLQFYSLSGGEKQKVLLAKALLSKPNLLILDEPTQNLDISSQAEFYKLLDEIYKKDNLAILMVSHDLHIVMSSSKKVICLFKHICCQGEPEEVSKNSEFISLFGQDMDQLLATYSHFHNHKH